ncbi:MAG: M20/M25/M40 family metallo-hydrolase [Gemmatimonadaceae bacterium]|nr:M20/M25/M40 family metallo-hydrolase [Gemmatimonadaceae bacterium]
MQRRIHSLPGLLLALALPAIRAAAQPRPGLSSDERRIAAYVASHKQEALSLLERIVNINSGTLNPAGVRAVGDVLRPEFDKIGLKTRWIEMPDSLHRAGHLFAEQHGTKGKKLILIGHLDTVFEKDSPFQRYTVIDSVTVAGPGVNDMKGGDVVMLYALKALYSIGALKDRTVIVAMTGDEEAPGQPLSMARKDLIDAGKRSDIALEFESAVRDDTSDYATISRRSSSKWELKVTGITAHSSNMFNAETGAGAVFEAARIVNEFYKQLQGERYLTFNPALFLGAANISFDASTYSGRASGKDNIIAPAALVLGDIRTISDEQLRSTREKMRAIVAQHLPRTSAEIKFTDGYPSMAPTAGNRTLVTLINGINRDLGLKQMPILDPIRRGAGDISFVAQYVDGMAGLGPQGNGGHTVKEDLDLASWNLQVERAALMIYRLTR